MLLMCCQCVANMQVLKLEVAAATLEVAAAVDDREAKLEQLRQQFNTKQKEQLERQDETLNPKP